MSSAVGGGFALVDAGEAPTSLRSRSLNYTTNEVGGPAWGFDHWRAPLPAESPGPPEPGKTWDTACRLLRHYEFSEPDIVRAAYDCEEPLLGRTMLLEGRFSGMRFYVGVRITSIVDRNGPGQQVWGWSYETLQGHLERGKINYQIVKHVDTGQVEFVIDSYSQRAPTLGYTMRLGWALFGHRRKILYYRECGRRMQRFTSGTVPPPAPPQPRNGIVFAPSDAQTHRFDRYAVRHINPG